MTHHRTLANRSVTDAHVAAVRWLPKDGAWSGHIDAPIANKLSSLWLYHGDLIDFMGDKGKNRRARLTPTGVQYRQAIGEARIKL